MPHPPIGHKDSKTLPPEYFADLVEYMHGDAGLEWVRVRIANGHPAPYNVTHFELGNEQYNPDFGPQVAAMESRAARVGMKGRLTYLWPTKGFGPNSADAPGIAALNMTSQLAIDLHAGGGFPGLPDARGVFVAPRTKGWGAMVSVHVKKAVMPIFKDLHDYEKQCQCARLEC